MSDTPMVPRFAVDPDLVALARSAGPGGAVFVTDREERAPIIGAACLEAGVADKCWISVVPSRDAIAAVENDRRQHGDFRPILIDPVMPDPREVERKVREEEFERRRAEAKVAEQVRDEARRAKQARNVARARKRQSHLADLYGMIHGMGDSSAVIVCHDEDYGRYVARKVAELRPDLWEHPRIAIFITGHAPGATREQVLSSLPDYAALLPMHVAPGSAIARRREEERKAKAQSEAEQAAELAPPTVSAAAVAELEARLVVCEGILGSLLVLHGDAMLERGVLTKTEVERAEWMVHLMREFTGGVSAARASRP